MCRNIKPLYNLDPPATEREIRDACLQFVRKISGIDSPSKINRALFINAVDAMADVVNNLLNNLEASGPPKNRQAEAEKARVRNAHRFAKG